MYPNPYKPILEIKGNLLTLMVLHLFESDHEKIAEELVKKMAKAPEFFQQAPIIIDLHAVQDDHIDLVNIKKLLQLHGLIPVAVRSANPQQSEVALELNLGLLTDAKSASRRRYLEPETEPVPASPLVSKIIEQPIRSGQQVVSLDGNLIILSMVSHGAEILAHQHIHVYGALRGRALAGVNGDVEARIFCQQLDAELLSIAGRYLVNEDLPDDLRGKPAQIYLENDSLKIKTL